MFEAEDEQREEERMRVLLTRFSIDAVPTFERIVDRISRRDGGARDGSKRQHRRRYDRNEHQRRGRACSVSGTQRRHIL